MNKNIIKLLSISCLILIIGCSQNSDESPTLIVGSDFSDSNVRVLSIDTFEVDLSTFKFDSIVTSRTNRLLLGQYEDSNFGKITASPYFKLITNNYTLDQEAELDSVALILGYDNYFYGDTTSISSIKIHRLIDALRPEEDDFYNTSSINYDVTPLATYQYAPEPHRDSLHVSLPYDFGYQLFNSISDEVDDTEELNQIFRGLVLIPEANNNASVTGFDTGNGRTYLRFFYKIPNEFGNDERTLDLYIDNFNVSYFNAISNNAEGTVLDELVDQEINLTSINSNNFSFSQSGVGYATRIQFPTIKDLYNYQGEGTLLSANLRLFPDNNSYDDNFQLRDSLTVNIADQNNDINNQAFGTSDPIYATFVFDDDEFNEVYLNVPVLQYLDIKLTETPEVDNALVLLLKDYNLSINRMLFNDMFSENSRAKLVLTYAIYNDE